MGSLERRLDRLEAERRVDPSRLSAEALRHMTDEELDALADVLEDGQGDGSATFEDLYRAVGERSRRALDAYFATYEALSRGEEPPARDPPGADVLDRHRRISERDEAARWEYQARNGYRIWKYYKK